MGQTNGIFHHFRAHDEVEILGVDHVQGLMTSRSRTSGMRATHPIKCRVVSSTLQEGRVVEVQYGKVSAVEADTQKSRIARISKGDTKICGMRHLAPSITPLALSLMRWGLGDMRCAIELGRYAERAATTQDQASFTALDGTAVELCLGSGTITPGEMSLGRGGRLTVQGIHLPGNLPETVITAIAGRRLDEVVDHPAIHDAGTVLQASNNGGSCFVLLAPATIDIAAAIAAATTRQRRAA